MKPRKILDNHVVLKVGGKHFMCKCTCNVFTKLSDGRYRCNGCRKEYV